MAVNRFLGRARVLRAFVAAFFLACAACSAALALAWAQSGAAAPFVENMAIYRQVEGMVQKEALADAATGYSATVSIEEHAGTMQLVSLLTWNYNGKTEDESGAGRVTWESTDAKVASVSPEGLVTAIGDGSCDVKCSIAADQGITGGVDAVATVHLNVSGQSNAARVTDISICCDGTRVDGYGDPIIKSVEESELATETLALYAEVMVLLDPAGGQTKSYSTKDGLLSKQVPGLADIVWSVENSDYADIDAVNGSYRQNNFGASAVYASWGQGTGYEVRQKATITYRDVNPPDDTDGFSPQTTLRIKAYYEVSTTGETFDKPPADDSGQFVVDKTLSLEQVQGIDSTTATYSSVDSGTGSYMTITGTGAYLSKLVDEAGVKIDGIDGFWFQTADSGGGVYAEGASYDFLFGTERYWYPRAKDGGKERYADAEQVWPIVAWETSQLHKNDGNCQPDYDMSNGRSFCLLMGGSKAGGNSSKWARNIKTIYIKLKGRAPAQGGDDDGGGKTDPVNPDDPPDSEEPDESPGEKDGGDKDGNGQGNEGDEKTGGKDNGGTAAGTGDSDGGSGTGDSDGGSGTGDSDGTNGGAQAGGKSGASRTPRAAARMQSETSQSKTEAAPTAAKSMKYYVYQGMNNNEVEDAQDLDYDNPLAPYVLPAALVVFFVGALQAAWWYTGQQRETRPPRRPRAGTRTSSG